MKIYFLAIVLFLSVSVQAEEGACTIDQKKFCGGFPPGDPIKKCLKDHVHELSTDCADFQAKEGKQAKEAFPKEEKTVNKNLKKAAEKGKKSGN